MKKRDSKQHERKLVTLQHESERNLSTGEVERRVYVKMYTDVRTSGLLNAMPDELWKTLCLLATYMDENGHCFPSQAELARHLNVRREAVGIRIQRLLDFRFEGEPVLAVQKTRTPKGHKRNEYTIYPITSFAIFDSGSSRLDAAPAKPMSGEPHMANVEAMSGSANMARANVGGAHSNQSQISNKKPHTVEKHGKTLCVEESNPEGLAELLIQRFHQEMGHSNRKPTAAEIRFSRKLLAQHGFERASYVIDYGVRSASETRFRARYFQSFRAYIDEALADHPNHVRRKRARDRAKQKQQEDEQRDRERETRWYSLPLEERVDRKLETISAARLRLKLGRHPTTAELEPERAKWREAEVRNEEEWRGRQGHEAA